MWIFGFKGWELCYLLLFFPSNLSSYLWVCYLDLFCIAHYRAYGFAVWICFGYIHYNNDGFIVWIWSLLQSFLWEHGSGSGLLQQAVLKMEKYQDTLGSSVIYQNTLLCFGTSTKNHTQKYTNRIYHHTVKPKLIYCKIHVPNLFIIINSLKHQLIYHNTLEPELIYHYSFSPDLFYTIPLNPYLFTTIPLSPNIFTTL